jgi:hypothetical protein
LPKPDFVEKPDGIGSFLSLPRKFSKPLLNEGDPLTIQDESRKHVKEPRFSEQYFRRLGQITPKLYRRFGDFLRHGISSLDYSNEIFGCLCPNLSCAP